MTHDEAFLEDILENPDDDTPRLVYADWLDDCGQLDRATFIRVQVERARRPDESDRTRALRRQAEELLRAHWDEWVRPLAAVVGDEPGEGWLRGGYHPESLSKFRRGFVSLLDMEARRFLRCAGELFRLAPIRHLRLRHAGEVAAQLAACPFLRWLEGLEFIDYYSEPIHATAMAHLADSPHLERLRYLWLYNNHLGDEGGEHLARARWLAGVEVLELGDNGLSSRGVSAVASTAQAFRPVRLRLGGNEPGSDGLAVLGNSPIAARLSVLALDNCRLGPLAAAALAKAAGLAALRCLDLDYNPLGDEGAVLLAQAEWMPRLASLKVHGCRLSSAGEQLLAQRQTFQPG
jgi:uncharacterized protein (TIGR02996 family)